MNLSLGKKKQTCPPESTTQLCYEWPTNAEGGSLVPALIVRLHLCADPTFCEGSNDSLRVKPPSPALALNLCCATRWDIHRQLGSLLPSSLPRNFILTSRGLSSPARAWTATGFCKARSVQSHFWAQKPCCIVYEHSISVPLPPPFLTCCSRSWLTGNQNLTLNHSLWQCTKTIYIPTKVSLYVKEL